MVKTAFSRIDDILVDNPLFGILIMQDNHMVFANETFKNMVGYGAGISMEKAFRDIVHPDDKDFIKKLYAERQKGKGIT